MPDAPVEFIPGDDPLRKPKEGIALCLSGGGYRAMLFHLGALWRLYETNLLSSIKHISSVSGGSITAGVLGLNWSKLSFDPANIQSDFVSHVITPVRDLASETIDRDATILGLALPGRVSDQIAASYDRHLFHGAKLNELPNQPTFVLNATNVQSGALWRFTSSYMRDYRVGEVKDPDILLALAVAASSAFPPVLSPVEIRLDPNTFTPNSGQDLQRKPFTSRISDRWRLLRPIAFGLILRLYLAAPVADKNGVIALPRGLKTKIVVHNPDAAEAARRRTAGAAHQLGLCSVRRGSAGAFDPSLPRADKFPYPAAKV